MAIKRFKSAFVFFMIKTHKRTSTNRNTLKTVGLNWRRLSEDDKAPYYEMERVDKDRWLQERQAESAAAAASISVRVVRSSVNKDEEEKDDGEDNGPNVEREEEGERAEAGDKEQEKEDGEDNGPNVGREEEAEKAEAGDKEEKAAGIFCIIM
jgi:hypothetical protein